MGCRPPVAFGTPVLLLPIDDLDLTLTSFGWVRTFGLGVGFARTTTVPSWGTSWRSSTRLVVWAMLSPVSLLSTVVTRILVLLHNYL